jgi:hypothetical protein
MQEGAQYRQVVAGQSLSYSGTALTIGTALPAASLPAAVCLILRTTPSSPQARKRVALRNIGI